MKYFIICCLMVLSDSVLGQIKDISFVNYTREQGLSDNNIIEIIQDGKGFIWVATREGLNRFDGKNFKIYTNKKHSVNSLSDNYIYNLYIDSKKRLWIAAPYALNLYDEKHDHFIRYMTYNESGSAKTPVYCLEENSNKQLIAGTNKGLKLFNEQRKKFEHYTLPGLNLSNQKINCLYTTKNGSLWIGTETSGIYNYHNGKINHFPLSLFSGRIVEINEDKDKNIWAGTDNGVYLLMNGQNSFTKISVTKHNEDEVAKSIYTDVSGNVWIAIENKGLIQKPAGQTTFLSFEHNPYSYNSLSEKTVSSIYQDRQGNLWVGTLRGGVNLYNESVNRFKLYSHGRKRRSISFKNVKSFAEDENGNIYIGTDGGGLNFWNIQEDTFEHMVHVAGSNSLSSDAVLNTCIDHQGSVWIGTWGGGLNIYYPATKTFRSFPKSSPNSIFSNNIWKIFQDKDKKIWIGTDKAGLNMYDFATGRFSSVKKITETGDEFYGETIYNIIQDRKGRIWVAGNKGLNCFDPATNRIDHYFITIQNNAIKSSHIIKTIFEDSRGQIWAVNNGLYLFNNEKNRFNLYDANLSIHRESIKSIQEDNKGNLWLGTKNGLVKFHPVTKNVHKFIKADGLQGMDFEVNASYKTSSGALLFGGYNGFNYFEAAAFKNNHQPPPIYITRVTTKVNNADSSINFSIPKNISLSYKQSNFTIEFAALNYILPEKNQYAYKLEGLIDEWTYIGNENKVVFTNIPTGNYVFKVKASNNDGVWSSDIATLNMTIVPPFWQTIWFKILALIILLGAFVQYWKMSKQILVKNISSGKQKELFKLQLDFFTNIAHDFRTPLSIIMGSIERLEEESALKKNTYTKLIEKNAIRLNNLLKELMDFRKAESGLLKLNVTENDTNLFIQEIASDFDVLAENKHIQFNIKDSGELMLKWFDKKVIQKIIFNLLNNSFKYTQDGGIVNIEISSIKNQQRDSYENTSSFESKHKPKNNLYITITDNGPGISASFLPQLFQSYYRIRDNKQEGSGIGLAFVKSLVLLHKGKMHIHTEENKGTKIVVSIPCDKSDYSSKEINRTDKNMEMVQMESIIPATEIYANDVSPVKEKTFIGANKYLPSIKPMILLAEDNGELRAFLRQSLEKDYEIIESLNGDDALQKVNSYFPSLIISDIMMPGIDGITLCKKVKENNLTTHIPFIILTAKDDAETNLESIHSGADFYFSKPISIKLLQLTLKNIFEHSNRLKLHYLKDYQNEVKENIHSVEDKEFMDAVLLVLENSMEQPDFNVGYLCKEIGMSQSKFYKKIKEITGKSIAEFVRTVRLKKATFIMMNENVSINEVMLRVGFSSSSYFTKAFKNEYGATPSEWQKNIKVD